MILHSPIRQKKLKVKGKKSFFQTILHTYLLQQRREDSRKYNTVNYRGLFIIESLLRHQREV